MDVSRDVMTKPLHGFEHNKNILIGFWSKKIPPAPTFSLLSDFY